MKEEDMEAMLLFSNMMFSSARMPGLCKYNVSVSMEVFIPKAPIGINEKMLNEGRWCLNLWPLLPSSGEQSFLSTAGRSNG